jgi:hypothetical protein
LGTRILLSSFRREESVPYRRETDMKCNNCEHISAWLDGTCDNCDSSRADIVTYDDLIDDHHQALLEETFNA